MKKILLLILITFVLYSCKKEGCTNQYAVNYDSEAEEDDSSCIAYVDEMEGTFRITVTSYPWQPSQEGEESYALVFSDYGVGNPSSPEDFNFIKFNNLFTFYGCDRYPLDKYTFNVSLEDDDRWACAPIEGTGTIKNGVFHFEGTVYTSEGPFPIVLDGIKISNERRTDAC